MFDRRLRTLRIVAMWCVRQVSPRPPPSSKPSKIDRNSRSRSAKVTTRCVPPNPSSNSLSTTRSERKSMKASAFIDFLSDRVVDKEFDDGFGGTHRVVTFADLERLFRSIFDGLELGGGRGDTWRTHHIATIRKVRNRLSNISTRCKGLVTDDGPSNDLPWGRFE